MRKKDFRISWRIGSLVQERAVILKYQFLRENKCCYESIAQEEVDYIHIKTNENGTTQSVDVKAFE